MKFFTTILLAAMTTPVLAQTNEEGVARDRAKAALVVHAAAVQIIEETERLSHPTVDDESVLISGLSRAMVEQPGRHQNVNESRKQSLATLADVQYGRVMGIISQTLAQARQQSPLPVSEEQVLAKTGSHAKELSDQAMSAWKSNGVEKLFVEARQQAVLQQRRVLDGQLTYPNQDAVDTLLMEMCQGMKDPAARVPRETWNRVREQLAQPVGGKDRPVLLEENEKFVKDTTARMSEAIRLQYDGQVGVLDEASQHDQLPGAAITSEVLEKFLQERVEQAVTRLTPESGAPRYLVLAPVRSNVTARAIHLEETLLMDYVSNRAEVVVTVDQIESLVRASPATYRENSTSRPVVIRELSAGLIPLVARSYAGHDGASGAVSRMEFLMAEDRPAGSTLRKRVQKDVETAWSEARDRVARVQYDAYFPGLDGDEPLTAEQAERGCDVLQPFPENFSDLVKSLRSFEPDWVLLEDQVIIEEAELMVAKAVRARVALACEAVENQLSLVREMEKEKMGALEKDVAAGRPFRNILKDWNDELAQRWSDIDGPGPAAYPELFPRAVDLLNKTVRQLYDARRQEQQQVQQGVSERAGAESSSDQVSAAPVDQRKDEFQSNATDQEPKDDNQSQPDPPEPKKLEGMGAVEYVWKTDPDAVLIVRDTRWKRAQVVLMDAEQQVLASATFRPDRIDDAAREIYALITPALTQALDDRKAGWSDAVTGEGEPGPQLKIFLFIQSREIRHLTSLRLRHLMQQQVDAWSAANRPGLSVVNLVWIVGL